MTHAEMKELYNKLYNTMATSKDVSKMMMFGAAMSAMFTEVARTNPTLAQTTLDRLIQDGSQQAERPRPPALHSRIFRPR